MEIITGTIQKPLKALVYGPEGCGKSTFASKWPKPLFLDIEDGTHTLEVARTPKAESWQILNAMIEELANNSQGFETIVIDTADWADKLAADSLCAAHKKSGIEDFGYGKGYVFLCETWKKFLDKIQELQNKTGVNVLFLAHAVMRKFDQPEDFGSYDRYEMKLEKKTSSLLKEWADLMLFANYEIIIVKDDNGKGKPQGGKRVMYASHHPVWDAKNRYNLPDKMAFDFSEIAHIFRKKECSSPQAILQSASIEVKTPSAQPEKQPEQKTTAILRPEGIPDKLWDLMIFHGVSAGEIQTVVAKKGYYPKDTPLSKYDEKFINGVLIAAFDKVLTVIKENRSSL